MSGAQARATALIPAYAKGASPGTALLDDDVASSSASSYQHQREFRSWGRGADTAVRGYRGSRKGERAWNHLVYWERALSQETNDRSGMTPEEIAVKLQD